MEETKIKETRKYFSKIGIVYFIGTIVLYQGLSYVIGLWINNVKPEWVENNNLYTLLLYLPMLILTFPTVWSLVNLIPKAQPIEKHKMNVGQMILAVIMSISILYVGNILGLVWDLVINMFTGIPTKNAAMMIMESSNLIISILLFVVIIPMFEEMLFRKFLVDRAIRYGEGVAVLLSGILFALYHGNVHQSFYAFAMGCFFAFIYIRTGKIIYTMCFHMCVNFIGIIVSRLVLEMIHYDELLRITGSGDMEAYMQFVQDNITGFAVYGFYIIFLFAITITGVILFIVFRKKFYLKPTEEKLPKGSFFKTVILNPGMLLYIISWIIIFVVVVVS